MRIRFSAWGKGDFKVPAYAVLKKDDGYSTPLGAVQGAIARKNGLECCAGPCRQGTALDRHGNPEADHYSFTLGDPCPGGGYTPLFEVWVSIPRGQVPKFNPAMEWLCTNCGDEIPQDTADYLCDNCRKRAEDGTG